MGKFNEWRDQIEETIKHDIQEKIYYELMLALGENPKEPELHFDEAADAVDEDMKKTIIDSINKFVDVSSET